MNDPLRDILSRADEGSVDVPVPAGEAVRRRAARRQAARRGVVAAAVVTLGAIVWFSAQRRPAQVAKGPTPRVSMPEVSDAMRREIAEIIRGAGRADRQTPPTAVDGIYRLQQSVAETAAVLVFNGDTMARDSDNAGAAEAYHRVIKLFPESPSAAEARDRLSDLGRNGTKEQS